MEVIEHILSRQICCRRIHKIHRRSFSEKDLDGGGIVTDMQKRKIKELRETGYSYASISKELSMSVNTVKSFCWRNKIKMPPKIIEPETKSWRDTCANCGKPLSNGRTGRPKRFCSELCRRAWWKEHSKESKKTAYYTLVCKECGMPFESYGNKNRKFCCHVCYIKNRFERVEGSYDSRAV